MARLYSMRRCLEKTYAADYAGFILLLTVYLWLEIAVEPFHRMFSLDDRSIQFPYARIERVPVSMMFLYAGFIPLVVLIITFAFVQPGWPKVHVTILGFSISLIITSFVTDVIKNTVGRPRPDLLDRCQPKAESQANVLLTIEACTQADRQVLDDGWRSFPSGHSSFSFAGLGYLALFLAGQLRVFRPQTNLLYVMIFMSPLIGALLIAISRLEDYRHDFYDVTAGSLLGALMAYISYRRYYPSLSSPSCNALYSEYSDNSVGTLSDEEEALGLENEPYERMPLQDRR